MIMFSLGVVPFKTTNLRVVWQLWTPLSVLSTKASSTGRGLPRGQRCILFVSVPLPLALNLAHTQPWWCSPNWRKLQIWFRRKRKCDVAPRPRFYAWRTKAEEGWLPWVLLPVSEEQGWWSSCLAFFHSPGWLFYKRPMPHLSPM